MWRRLSVTRGMCVSVCAVLFMFYWFQIVLLCLVFEANACVCVMVHAHRETYASGFVSRSDPNALNEGQTGCLGGRHRDAVWTWTFRMYRPHILHFSKYNKDKRKLQFVLQSQTTASIRSCILLDFTLISALFVFQFVSIDWCTFLEPLSMTILAIFTQLWHTSPVSLHTIFPLCNSESKNYFWVLLLHFLCVLLWWSVKSATLGTF